MILLEGFVYLVVERSVDGCFAWVSDPLVPNDPVVIEYIERRRSGVVPFAGDRTLVGVASPVQLLLAHHLLEACWVVARDVYPDQCKRFVFKFINERPLMRPMCPSRDSVLTPEIKQNDFASIIT